ncbi:MAG: zinc ABC transporter substrate-binding protein, partial [Deltaproteobacteria bacterium]|nr:zinc ABC transporter substrate-binding protein [Deltaproteobacteria bacterium]
MIDIAKKKGIKIIFVQKGFDTKNARAIAEDIGGKVYEIDPLAKDWLKNMEDVAKIISKALKR